MVSVKTLWAAVDIRGCMTIAISVYGISFCISLSKMVYTNTVVVERATHCLETSRSMTIAIFMTMPISIAGFSICFSLSKTMSIVSVETLRTPVDIAVPTIGMMGYTMIIAKEWICQCHTEKGENNLVRHNTLKQLGLSVVGG